MCDAVGACGTAPGSAGLSTLNTSLQDSTGVCPLRSVPHWSYQILECLLKALPLQFVSLTVEFEMYDVNHCPHVDRLENVPHALKLCLSVAFPPRLKIPFPKGQSNFEEFTQLGIFFH